MHYGDLHDSVYVKRNLSALLYQSDVVSGIDATGTHGTLAPLLVTSPPTIANLASLTLDGIGASSVKGPAIWSRSDMTSTWKLNTEPGKIWSPVHSCLTVNVKLRSD